MARDDHQLKFRVPDGLKQRIEETARENKRSLNAEIIAALEYQYPELLPEARRLYKRIYELAGWKEGDEFTELHKAIDAYLTYMSKASLAEVQAMFDDPWGEDE